MYTASWSQEYVSACEATRVRGDQSEEVLDLRMACLARTLEEVKTLTGLFARPSVNAEVLDKALSAVSGLPAPSRCADVLSLRRTGVSPSSPEAAERALELRRQIATAASLERVGGRSESLDVAAKAAAAAATLADPGLEAEAVFQHAMSLLATGDGKAATPLFRRASRSALVARNEEVATEAAARLGHAIGAYYEDPAGGEEWLEIGESVAARLSDPSRQAMRGASTREGLGSSQDCCAQPCRERCEPYADSFFGSASFSFA
ncbi:MAG: hypothetical protein ACT4TC_00890 [Myxococcaceae bacterium]